MQARELIDEASTLSVDEKLRVVEEIWDSIAASDDAPPLSEWQKAELDRRERQYRHGAERLHAAEEVHAGLQNRR